MRLWLFLHILKLEDKKVILSTWMLKSDMQDKIDEHDKLKYNSDTEVAIAYKNLI